MVRRTRTATMVLLLCVALAACGGLPDSPVPASAAPSLAIGPGGVAGDQTDSVPTDSPPPTSEPSPEPTAEPMPPPTPEPTAGRPPLGLGSAEGDAILTGAILRDGSYRVASVAPEVADVGSIPDIQARIPDPWILARRQDQPAAVRNGLPRPGAGQRPQGR